MKATTFAALFLGIACCGITQAKSKLSYGTKEVDSDDGVLHLAKVGSYEPNIWGLHDMHGNVAEWTSSDYSEGKKTILGGSWRDRPHRAAAGFKLGFPAWQKLYNVGFRVITEQ